MHDANHKHADQPAHIVPTQIQATHSDNGVRSWLTNPICKTKQAASQSAGMGNVKRFNGLAILAGMFDRLTLSSSSTITNFAHG